MPPKRRNGLNDLEWMIKAALDKKGGRKALESKFKYFDLDGSGALAYPEFFKAIEPLAQGVDELEIRALFRRYDSDRSGEVSMVEFCDGVLGKTDHAPPTFTSRADAVSTMAKRAGTNLKGVAPPLPKPVKIDYKQRNEENKLKMRQEAAKDNTGRGGFRRSVEPEEPWRQGNQHARKVQTMLKLLRGSLKRRGSVGINGLNRVFHIMDDDGSKTLSLAEFKKAMREFFATSDPSKIKSKDPHIVLDDTEVLSLFRHFDKDGNGAISFEEFLNGIREPMNSRRQKLVSRAFVEMDQDRNGIIDLEDIRDKYDVTNHQDYVGGRKTKDEILLDFLQNFEVGGDINGKVTTEEFNNYYQNVSNSIDDDNYFELMMRNSWHISGGEGECGNTTCARVLVRDSAGIDKIFEVKNDLGFKKDDYEDILRARGIDCKEILW